MLLLVAVVIVKAWINLNLDSFEVGSNMAASL